MRTRLNSLPLFWRVFGTNAAVLVLAFLALVFAPVTVSVPPAAIRAGRARCGPRVPARAQSGAAAAGVPAARRARRDDARARSALPRQTGARRRRAGDRRARPDLQRDARSPGVRAARQRSPGTARPGGRAPADRARAARRGRSDAHRRDAPGRGTGRRDPGRAPRATRRASRDRSSRHGGGAPDRTPAAPRSARGPRAAKRAGCAGRPRSASRRRLRIERRLEPGLPLSQEQELVVYRIAQEALTNVARHADATEVQLHLERADEPVILTVRDDGGGLPPGAFRSSHGIRGMRERAMLIGAQLTIAAPPAGGTEVQLSIPLEPRTA